MRDVIQTVADLQRLVAAGETNWRQYGEVTTKEYGGLILFNYLPTAQYINDWNAFELMSRGLILDRRTGDVVALPMAKFFNWLEAGRKASGHIVTVTEKCDGSLGIAYHYKDSWRVATRGSFDSTQAVWATRFMNGLHDTSKLDPQYTYMFEIIYPENRIVVDYGKREDMVLLAIRNRETGQYLPFFPDVYSIAAKLEFPIPQVYAFNDVTQILEQTGLLDANQEGFVIEFSDGSRWKIKGDRYLELHKLISSISFKNTLRALQAGTLHEIYDAIPDEFLVTVRQWVDEIEHDVEEILVVIWEAYHVAPKETRKEFALWVKANHNDIAPYLFAILDDKDVETMIYRSIEQRGDRTLLTEE